MELRHSVSGAPAAGLGYTLVLADGTERAGTLGADGVACEEGLPPGPVEARYDAPPPSAPPPLDASDALPLA